MQKYKLVKAFHPLKFEEGVYAVQFVESGKKYTDEHTRFFQVVAKNRTEAIRKARIMLRNS